MIEASDLKLTYEVHHDQTRALKEAVVNLFHRRKFAEKKLTHFNALDGVSFKVSEGDRLGIIGRNGAGKSTLLKVISGVLKPTSGVINVEGAIQPLIEISAGFNPEFSGRENIYFNGYMLGFSRKQIQQKEAEIVEFAELNDFINVPVKYYSSGMSVRLAFAIATSIEPEILIFDEMLSAGDAHFAKKAQERMRQLIDKSKCMVIVSHDLSLLETLANRVIWLEKGSIKMEGEPQKVISSYLEGQ